MSIDFNAVFDIGPEFAGPTWLKECLRIPPRGVSNVIAYFGHRWTPKEWTLEPSSLDLYGPGGYHFRFGPATVNLYHVIRFRTFARDSSERAILRASLFEIANLLGSPCSIYFHELLPLEGASLAEIESSLRQEFGAPSATFEELAATEEWGQGCWFIDTFADMRQDSNHRTEVVDL